MGCVAQVFGGCLFEVVSDFLIFYNNSLQDIDSSIWDSQPTKDVFLVQECHCLFVKHQDLYSLSQKPKSKVFHKKSRNVMKN